MFVYRFTFSMKVPLERAVRTLADSADREQRMSVLNENMKAVAGPLQEIDLRGVFVKSKELVQ